MKHFFYGAMGTFVAYGLIAFITWETDPEKWTWPGRVFAVMLLTLFVAAGFVATLEDKK